MTESKIITFVNCIRGVLRTKNPKHSCTIKLKYELGQKIAKRFNRLEQHFILALATVLDPRYKILHLQDPLAESKTTNTLNGFMENIDVEARPANASPDQSDLECKERREFDI